MEKVIDNMRGLHKTDNIVQASLDFNEFSLDFLCDYIVNTHYQYVQKTLPKIVELASKVSNKHAENFPELIRINDLVLTINVALILHQQKEERVLFPFIKKLIITEIGDLDPELIAGPIRMMEMEHESLAVQFREIERLTNKFVIPQNACNSFHLFYNMLDEFYNYLMIQFHLENNILFPKVLNLLKR